MKEPDKTEGTLKTYEELWTKIRDLTGLVTNNSDNYDQNYMKIKFNLDKDLALEKTLELHTMVIVVRFVFHDDNKYYL